MEWPVVVDLALYLVLGVALGTVGGALSQVLAGKMFDLHGVAGMFGMIARIKHGSAVEKIAAAARAAIVPEGIEEIQPRWLAQDIYLLSKRKTAEMITAHYKGKRYLLDGTVGEPLETDGTVELWYKVTIDSNGILQTKAADQSAFWPPIVCRMADEHHARALKLQSGEYAKLTGTVSHYQPGIPSKLVLKDCRFE